MSCRRGSIAIIAMPMCNCELRRLHDLIASAGTFVEGALEFSEGTMSRLYDEHRTYVRLLRCNCNAHLYIMNRMIIILQVSATEPPLAPQETRLGCL